MKHLQPSQFELAFVPPGTLFFSDVAARVADMSDLSETRRRDLLSGLRRVAEILDRDMQNVPADPRWLQPRLNAILPATHGLTPKTWQNLVSNANAALVQVGIVRTRMYRLEDLDPRWRPLWQSALATGQRGITATLRAFIYFLNGLGVGPDEVHDGHMDAYREALRINRIRRDPDATCRAAIHAWNRAAAQIEGWPKQKLSRALRMKVLKLPLSSLPDSFGQDLDRFCYALRHPDLLSGDDHYRPMRDSSILSYRRSIERFAGILVRSGMAVEDIMDLSVLIDPASARRGLEWMLEDSEGTIRPRHGAMAQILLLIARRHVRTGDDALKKLETFVRNLSVSKRHGMTPKNRERLRPLLDRGPRDLLLLPDRLFERAGQSRKNRDCLLREQAIGIAILMHTAIRRGNLVSIHIDRHLQRSGLGSTYLAFDASEVKNRESLEFQLPNDIVKMIEIHLALRHPGLCPPGSPWLFPRRDGSGPIQADTLAKMLKRRIERELGLTINLHLYRHFAAHLLLTHEPGNYEAARRFLGHSRLSTTLNAYTGLETTTASRIFSDILEQEKAR